MALILQPELPALHPGVYAGSVFQITQGGFQIRTRSKPRDPKSYYQQLRRADMSYQMFSWKDISESDQESWIGNAPPGVPGHSFYLGQNALLNTSGLPPLTTYSSDFDLQISQFNMASGSPEDLVYAVNHGDFTADDHIALLFYATKILPAGQNQISPNSYVYIESVHDVVGTGTLRMVQPNYVDKIGPLAPGMLVAGRCILISAIGGFSSEFVYDRTFIGDFP